MKLTIIFKEKFEEHMKKQFGHFTNPQVYGVKSVHVEGGYLYSTISDTVRWRMDDISRFYCDECKWMQDEVCVNADCPACADYCPVANTPGVCKYEERGNSDAQKGKRQTGAE